MHKTMNMSAERQTIFMNCKSICKGLNNLKTVPENISN